MFVLKYPDGSFRNQDRRIETFITREQAQEVSDDSDFHPKVLSLNLIKSVEWDADSVTVGLVDNPEYLYSYPDPRPFSLVRAFLDADIAGQLAEKTLDDVRLRADRPQLLGLGAGF